LVTYADRLVWPALSDAHTHQPRSFHRTRV